MNLLFSPGAAEVLDVLEKDSSNTRFVDAIWDVLDLVIEHPGSAQARHRSLRTAPGRLPPHLAGPVSPVVIPAP
ncbi:MAG TPA: hypothetical protein VIX15_10390 [Streptosporangiaceae bacterium]